jgi:ATP-dependent exoDNAse (exonuclease V) alpha subunit
MDNKFTRYRGEQEEKSTHVESSTALADITVHDSKEMRDTDKYLEEKKEEKKQDGMIAMPDKITIDMLASGQQDALKILTEDDWFLYHLTGQAGAGKSFLINYLRQNYMCAVTAATAVAAQLIGGSTLHKATGYWDGNMQAPPRFDMTKMAESLSGFDYLIVDECSMISKRMFNELYKGFKLLMARGVRIILVGDFMQLPPVPSRLQTESRKFVTLPDSDIFAFHSEYWAMPNYDLGRWEHTMVKGLNLNSQHRQSDRGLINALNSLRRGEISNDLRTIMRTHTSYNLPEDCVILAPKRKTVTNINRERLAKIDEQEYTFDAEILAKPGLAPAEGMKPNRQDVVDTARQGRFPHELILKEGARVMMLMNHPEGKFVNGTAGEVKEFDMKNNIIYVDTDDGRTIDVHPAEEIICDHKGKELVSIVQFPMMLAFAITIHKSQGCTLDRAGIILDDHFAHGQTYVSMTRVKSEDGLFLQGFTNRIITDPIVLGYMNSFGWL